MRFKIKVAGHAVQGRGHAKQNIVCQDKVRAFRFRDKRSAIVALADGAGSCTHSHIGAEYVVNNIGSIIHGRFEEYFFRPALVPSETINKLQDGLKSLARSEGVDMKALSSTLLFVYARKCRGNTKRSKFIAGHIGDGAIGVLAGKKRGILSHPENGEYASSTFFLTSPKATSHLRVYTGQIKGNASFLLLSDGTCESLYSRQDGSLAPACDFIFKWFDRLPQKKIAKGLEKNLRNILRFFTLDDCSIAALGLTGLEVVRLGKSR
jgi:hypothetical protein